jgi:NhaP-type Na+/H+ or K+/H+ antiporter
VLLLVLGGLLLSASVEVLLNRARITWLPGSAIATLLGVGVGSVIRVAHGPAELPGELNFSGTVFFLLILPIIMFEAGWSLRKKEFLGSFFTLVAFSVLGTTLAAFTTGGILYGAGAAGWCKPFGFNEAMAFGSILSATDAASSATIYSGLGVDPRLTTLVGGEGSLNDAVSIVLYQTFSGFLTDAGAVENGETITGRFLRMLLGSVGVGLGVGVGATLLFRTVHIGAERDPGLQAARAWLCARRCGSRPRGDGEGNDERVPLARRGASSVASSGGYSALHLSGGVGSDD